MIKTILFQNFGPFEHLHIKIEPLTILCGDNGSGKSLIWNTILSVRDSMMNGDDSLIELYKKNSHKDKISLIRFNIKIIKDTMDHKLLKYILKGKSEDTFNIEFTILLYEKYSLYKDVDLGVCIKIKEFPEIHVNNNQYINSLKFMFNKYYIDMMNYNIKTEILSNLTSFNNNNPTMILNHPETGYHPDIQLQITDHILDIINNQNKNVILETHSEHIINRLMRRVNEDLTTNIIDNTVIYNLSGKENVKCDEVKIGQYGISDWPNGFFDQSIDEAEKSIMAGIKKRKILRSSE
jgi:predicted ATPase